MEGYTYKPRTSLEAPEEKKEEIKVEQVTSKPVKVRKKNKLLTKFAQTFISADIQDVKSYIIKDVVIPTVKETFLDSLGMLLGVDRKYGKRSILGDSIYTPYAKIGSAKSGYSSNPIAKPAMQDYDDLLFETKGEALMVLESMRDLISKYGHASILHYYDLAGMGNITRSSDNDYGWTNLDNVDIVPTRDGCYRLTMPRALPL